MGDSDYDGDIADEDLIQALTQTATPAGPKSTTAAVPPRRAAANALPISSSNQVERGGALQSRGNANASFASTATVDLDGLPSDAFDSDGSSGAFARPIRARAQGSSGSRSLQRSLSGSQSFRQTTLWGDTLRDEPPSQSQGRTSRAYLVDLPPEKPSQHELNKEAMKTWVYPTNLGPIRDYQFSIVKNSLFHNTLVALPTGLGKTFIAATAMLNFYRWTKSAKIIFVAPTKPLVSQQVEACLNVTGIPRSEATLLTGETAPALREDEWASKRLFFMTPQTLENDLAKGYADPKSVVLVVVDEAHKATGNYAYVKVVSFLRRFNQSFRVLALTATPGSTVEGVQEVIDNLGISHVEIRTEQSMDIRRYVHSRDIDERILEPSDEILHIQDLFSKALKPLVDKLGQQNIWYGRDPMGMTTYGLMKAQEDWMKTRGRHVNQGLKFMIGAVFRILCSLAHAVKLLTFHGIVPFYHNLQEFRTTTEAGGEKGSKYKQQIVKDPNFIEMMSTVEKWLRLDGFVGHPKLTYLCDTLLNHFMDAGEGSNTRAIVFSEYRDSAEEVIRILNQHKPLINASIFVGQADSKRSGGMKQAQQIEAIADFTRGKFNVLVATSIGEEGLDIGQVDLIVCYDASASPIRMLQRMGRTGRKRAGNIVMLMMKGKEEEKFRAAKDNYEKMQLKICAGTDFNFRHDLSSRIVPRDIKPEVDKRVVDIPIENTQAQGLPEPKKSRARKKASKKVFHMPDDVETGFVKATLFGQPPAQTTKRTAPAPVEADFLEDVPNLDSVVLSADQMAELNVLYRGVPVGMSGYHEIEAPDLTRHPRFQRQLSGTVHLQHGSYTKRCVRLFGKLASAQAKADRYYRPWGHIDTSNYEELPAPPFADDYGNLEQDAEVSPAVAAAPRKRTRVPTRDQDADSLPKRRKPGSNPKSKPVPKALSARKRSRPASFVDVSGEEDEDEGDEEEEEAFDEAPKRRGRPKKAGGRGAASRRGTYHNLEEVGDDCTRTSQLYESDGSDSGADLADFIVDDDEVISSMRQGSTSPTTVSPAPESAGQHRSRGAPEGARESAPPYYVPTSLTQDSDEEMPSMSQIAGRKAPKTQQAPKRARKAFNPFQDSSSEEDGLDGSEDEDVQARPGARKSRRPVIEDNDSA